MDLEQYRRAIRQIESGGDYGAIGPVTAKGNRAYGADQVMDFNIGPWTKKWYGEELTPEQYLRNEAAQDAVFNGQFGSYLERYGNPEDAASMWFTGRPLAQGADRRDVLGTTGSGYVQKFNRALKGGDMEQPFISTHGGQEEEQPGFLSNPNVWDALALGFNSMRLNPDEGLSRAVQARMQARQEQAKSKQTINKTVEMLTRIGADPKLIEAARAGYAKEALSAALTAPKDVRTAAMKNYDQAVAGGYKGTFMDYQSELQRAGTTPGETARTAYDKENYKLLGKTHNNMLNAGYQASSTIYDLETLLDAYRVAPTGPLSGRLAEAFPEYNDAASVVQALRTKIAPNLRVEGSGSTSDMEFNAFLNSLGSMRNSPEANEVIIEAAIIKARINQARAQKISEMQQQGADPVDIDRAVRELDAEMWTNSAAVRRGMALLQANKSTTATGAPQSGQTSGGIKYTITPPEN